MAGPPVLDRPPLGLNIPIEQEELGSFGGFPDSFLMIAMGEGKYAANNASTPPPDPITLDGLACFPAVPDAELYTLSLKGLQGEIVQKSFAEAREIALSKPKINSLLLFVNNRIVEYTFVR